MCAGQWGFTNAQNLAVYGKLIVGSGDQPLLPGWAPSTVTLQSPTTCPPTAGAVVVRLQAAAPYTAVMLAAVGFPNSLTFTIAHEERHIGE